MNHLDETDIKTLDRQIVYANTISQKKECIQYFIHSILESAPTELRISEASEEYRHYFTSRYKSLLAERLEYIRILSNHGKLPDRIPFNVEKDIRIEMQAEVNALDALHKTIISQLYTFLQLDLYEYADTDRIRVYMSYLESLIDYEIRLQALEMFSQPR